VELFAAAQDTDPCSELTGQQAAQAGSQVASNSRHASGQQAPSQT
jgi:hypothetical protein